MAIILGIDPGSRTTGYGIIEATGNNQKYIASGCIRATIKTPLPERLAVIFQGISQILKEFSPTEVAVERIFVAKSAESALKLGQARGVAIVAAANQGLPVHEYEARKVKQAIVGSGAATKAQVQHMVMAVLNLESKLQADASDALAIAICHNNYRFGLGQLTEKSDDFFGSSRFRRGRYVSGKRVK